MVGVNGEKRKVEWKMDSKKKKRQIRLQNSKGINETVHAINRSR